MSENKPLPENFWDDSDPELPQRARTRGPGCLGRLVRWVVLLVLVAVLLHLAVDQYTQRKLRRLLTVQAVQPVHAAVPADENAVTYYVQAVQELDDLLYHAEGAAPARQALEPLLQNTFNNPPPTFTPEQVELLKRTVEAGESVWPTLLKAFEQPHFRSSYMERPMPEDMDQFETLPAAAHFALARAYVLGQDGDADGACDALMIALHIALQFWQEDMLICGALGSALAGETFTVARAIHEETPLTDACMENFILATRTFRDPNRAFAQLQGERAYHYWVLENRKSKAGDTWRERLLRPLQGLVLLQVEGEYQRVFNALKASNPAERDQLLEAKRGIPLLVHSGFGMTLRQFSFTAERYRLIELSFHVLLYRNQQGRYPDSLEEAAFELPEDLNIAEFEVSRAEQYYYLKYLKSVPGHSAEQVVVFPLE